MKKFAEKFLLVLWLALFVCIAFSCTEKTSSTDTTDSTTDTEEEEEEIEVDYVNIASMEVMNTEALQTEGFLLDTFSIGDIKIRITYKNEETVEIPVTYSMVKAEDKAKLRAVGTHKITLLYGKYTLDFTVKLYTVNVKIFTVTFLDEDNNRIGDIQHVKEGQIAQVPNLESKEGKIFLGWKLQGTETIVTTFSFTSDAVLIASYTSDTYLVYYYSMVGDVVKQIGSAEVKRGGSALEQAPQIGYEKGYSNGRWQNEEAMKSVNEDGMKFYAVYDKDYINATFVYHKFTDEDYSYDVYWKVSEQTEGLNAPDDVDRSTDYIFQYWYTKHIDSEGNEVQTQVTFPYVLESETTFYAHYISSVEGSNGLTVEWLEGEDIMSGYYITAYNGTDSSVVIPTYYNDNGFYGESPIIGIYNHPFNQESGKNIQKFSVSPDNEYFRIYNDALYTADLSTLLAFPLHKNTSTFEVTSSTVTLTAIGEYAFFGATNIKKIVLPSTLVSIGKYAFANCTSLEKIDITSTVHSIGEYAFAQSKNVNELTFSARSTLESIGKYAFSGLSISRVTLPGSVTSIGEGIFFDCRKLTTISVGTGSMFKADRDSGCLYGPKDAQSTNNPYYYLYAYPAKNTYSSTGEINLHAGTRVVLPGAFGYADIMEISFESITNSIRFESGSIVCPTLQTIRLYCADVTFSTDTFTAEDGTTFLPDAIYCVRTNEEEECETERKAKAFKTAVGSEDMQIIYTGKAEYKLFYNGFAYQFQIIEREGKDVTVAVIVAYRGQQTTLDIPTTLGGYEVYAIRENAFRGNTILQTVNFSESKVEKIESYAFYECSSLQSVTLNKEAIAIEDCAFARCFALSDITYADRTEIQFLGTDAFSQTDFLRSSEFVVLGGALLAYNGTIGDLSLPEEICIIGNNVFEGCDFIVSLSFGENAQIKEVQKESFKDCTSLPYVIFPHTVTVGENAFQNSAPYIFTKGVTDYTCTYPDGTRDQAYILYEQPTWEGHAVEGWYLDVELENEIVFPYLLTEDITLYAKTVPTETATEGLTFEKTSVGTYRLTGCTASTESLIIPAKVDGIPVTEIKENAFSGSSASSIKVIYFMKDSDKNTDYISVIGKNAFSGTAWYQNFVGDTVYLQGKLIRYKGNASVYRISDSMKVMADGAFENCVSLKKIYVSSAMKAVSKDAFFGCISLEEIVFGATGSNVVELSKIEEKAFYGCTKLAKINYTSCPSLDSVAYDAFDKTAWLNQYPDDNIIINSVYYRYIGKDGGTLLHIPNSITVINPYAFYHNTNLFYIYIPESVQVIGAHAFENSAVKKVFFPKTKCDLETIEEYAFYGCSSVMDFDLCDCSKLITVERYAFAYIKSDPSANLKITFPEKLVTVGENAFAHSDICTVYFANGSRLEVISESMFEQCEKLVSVSFLGTNYLQVIDKKAFSGCTSLQIFQNGFTSVNSIEAEAFYGCTALSVFSVLDTTLTYIGENAFAGTPVVFSTDTMIYAGTVLLKYNGIASEVYIPDGTTVISANAFMGNNRVTSIVFGANSKIYEIQEYAFRDCVSLMSISLPESIEYCAPGAFAGCTNLKNVSAYSSFTTYGYITVSDVLYRWTNTNGQRTAELVYYPNKDASIFTVPDVIYVNDLPFTVNRLADYCFEGCTCLKQLTIGNKVLSIGKEVLVGCNTLQKITTPFVGESIDSRRYSFFKYFFGAETYSDNVDVPQTLQTLTVTKQTSLADHAFYACLSPCEIILNTVKEIGDEVFTDSIGLLSLTIPELDRMGRDVLDGCNKLLYISNEAQFTDLPSTYFNTFDNSDISYTENGLIILTKEETKYAVGYIGNATTLTLSSAVSVVLPYAFYENNLFERVIFSDVRNISVREYAFASCIALKEITFTEKVKMIGNHAFENCVMLKEIVLPDSVTEISAYAFAGCEKAESVKVGNSVSAIREGAFSNCISLRSVSEKGKSALPDTLDSVDSKAFYSCILLESVALPEYLTSIGAEAFSLSGLTSVTIPNSVLSIGGKAFFGCENLISVNIESNPTYGVNVFGSCATLSDVTVARMPESMIFADLFNGIGEYFYNGEEEIYSYEEAGTMDTAHKTVTLNGQTLTYQTNLLYQGDTEVGTFSEAEKVLTISGNKYHFANDFIYPFIGNLDKDNSLFTIEDKTYYFTTDLTVYEKIGELNEVEKTLICNGLSYRVILSTNDCYLDIQDAQKGTIDIVNRSLTLNGNKYFYENTALYGEVAETSVYDEINVAERRITLSGVTYCFDEEGKIFLLAGNIQLTNFFNFAGERCFFIKNNLYREQEIEGCIIDLALQTIVFRHDEENADWYCYGGEGNCIYESKGSIDLTTGVITFLNGKTYYIRGAGLYGEGSSSSKGTIYKNRSFFVLEGETYYYDGNDNIYSVQGTIDLQTGFLTVNGTEYAFENYIIQDEQGTNRGVYDLHAGKLEIDGNMYCLDDEKRYLYPLVGSVRIDGSRAIVDGVEYTFENNILYCDKTVSGSIYTDKKELIIGNLSVKKLTVRGGVTLSAQAFKGCSSITTLLLPANMCDMFNNCLIEDGALLGLGLLSTLQIPIGNKTLKKVFGSVPSSLIDITVINTREIVPFAFEGCTTIQKITWDNRLKSIGQSAFSGCTSLEKINESDNIATKTISHCENITTVGKNAFANTAWLGNFEAGALYVGKVLYRFIGNGTGSYDIEDGTIALSEYAFYGCNNIATITVPASVTAIGAFAFSNCNSLNTVNIDNENPTYVGYTENKCILRKSDFCLVFGYGSCSVPSETTGIGENAFYECNNLVNISFPTPSLVTTIGENAFYGCTKLSAVVLPDTLSSMGKNVFSQCGLLKAVSLPFVGKSVDSTRQEEKVMEYVFGQNTLTALENVTITGGTADNIIYCSLVEGAFDGCTNVKQLTLSNLICSIDAGALNGCNNLTNLSMMIMVSPGPFPYVVEGNCLISTYLDELIFGCVESTIPDTGDNAVLLISDKAFSGCRSLTLVTSTGGLQPNANDNVIYIPSTVKSIGKNAFSGCTNLSRISLPITISDIGKSAFSECPSLQVADLPFVGEGSLSSQRHTFVSIFGSYPEDLTQVTISGGTSLADGAFKDCKNITSLTLPASIETIGKAVFYGCSSLLEINIPDSVETIGEKCFYNCKKMDTITIGKNVEHLEYGMFEGCTALGTVEISTQNNTYKSESNCIIDKTTNTLIFGCYTTTVIPIGVEIIGERAFYGCEKLETISITGSSVVYTIEESAFENCIGLKSFQFSGSVTTIGRNTFKGCSSLFHITFANGLTQIGESAFQSCISLAMLEFPDSLRTIGDRVFFGCSALASVSRTDLIEYVGVDAFTGTAWYASQKQGEIYIGKAFYCYKGSMSNETSLDIKSGTVSITEKAFKGYTKLTSITLPSGLRQIGKEAFAETGITSVVIPQSTVLIGENAFYHCQNLTSVAVYAGNLTDGATVSEDLFPSCNLSVFVAYGTEYHNGFIPNLRNYYLELQGGYTEVDGCVQIAKDQSGVIKQLPDSVQAVTNIVFSSSDETCAVVDNTGRVTAKAKSTDAVEIRATITIGELTFRLSYSIMII